MIGRLQSARLAGGVRRGFLILMALALAAGAAAMFYLNESPQQVWDRITQFVRESISGPPKPPPPPAPAPPPAEEVPAPTPEAEPSPQATPVPEPTPEATPTPPPPPDPLAWLLENRAAWPREVKLAAPEQFEAVVNGRPVGSVAVPSGAVVRLISMDRESVTVGMAESVKRIPIGSTDLAGRAAAAMEQSAARKARAEQALEAKASAVPVPAAPAAKAGFDPAKKLTRETFRTSEHPRVFARKDQLADLKKKIRDVPWAKEIYEDIEKRVTPLVERHEKDPGYIVSRLALHWGDGRHYTKFGLAPDGRITQREGNAPYPTVAVDYGRTGTGGAPPLDEMTVYFTGDKLRQNRGGKIVEIDAADAGQTMAQTNSQILNRAYDAAVVYYFTGDKKYAKFAADILWTFCRGASYQEQIIPNKDYQMNGFLCWETIRDSAYYSQIPLIYDFLHDYLVSDYFESSEFKKGRKGEPWAPGHPEGGGWAMERIHTFFQKYMDNKLERGGGLEGNWNMNEHRSGMLYALAMDDDKDVKNGKGREYYVSKFLSGPTTEHNGAYLDVAKANISPLTGLWPEAPAGYGQGSIAQLIQFGYWYYQNGIDVLGQEPLIRKAGTSFPQVAFPNGRTTGWGDGGNAPMMTATAEYLIAYARAHGDKDSEATFTGMLNFTGDRKPSGDEALFFYVPELDDTKDKALFPRASFSETHSLIFERNLSGDPKNGLAYTVYGFGSKSGHRHRNGMAMELYGRGHVLGVDPGAGPDYWHPQHSGYNNQVGAHNTVIPNGTAADRPMDLQILNVEPAVGPEHRDALALCDQYQFTDTGVDYNGKADQRRVMGIVRTTPEQGFYVDIFRSKSSRGADKQHDYLYHNMGTGLSLMGSGGQPLELKDAPLDPASGPGYNYFETIGSASYAEDFHGRFDFGESGIQMDVWMPGGEDRTLFSLTGPNNFRYYQNRLKEVRVPTLMVRQLGEAWKRPFVAIYEPSGNGAASTVRQVRLLKGADTSDDFVGILIQHSDDLNGRVDRIVNSTNPERIEVAGDLRFQGIYGAVSSDRDGLRGIYLGTGVELTSEYGSIKSRAGAAGGAGKAGGMIKASLIRSAPSRPLSASGGETGYVFSSDSPVEAVFSVAVVPGTSIDGARVTLNTKAGAQDCEVALTKISESEVRCVAQLPSAWGAPISIHFGK